MIISKTNQSTEQKILIEQVTMLFQSITSLVLINLIVCLCLAFAFWDIIPHPFIIAWCGLMLAMLLTRTGFYFSYKQNFSHEKIKRFSNFLVIGSASAGIVWGLGGLLLFPANSLAYQIFIIFSLLAMTGGSTFTLSIYLPAYFSFSPIVLLPMSIKLFTMGETIYYSLAAVVLVYLAALTVFNIKINQTFKRSLELRYENLDLIEQLKEQKTEADRANAAKSKFLAAASHDLRQPLYSLSLFTSVLDESTESPKIRKIVNQINHSVDALKELFDALLDISKLDAGVVTAEKESFRLQNLFDTLSNDFDMQASDKGLAITWPKCEYHVFSEPSLLEQILLNYLSNALRYTESGSITIACREKYGLITISVTDTGIGIPQDELQDVFTEFHQVGNAERDRANGLGLGLAIVDRTAKLLGHEIHATSSPGKGSTFTVSVERSEAPATPRSPNIQIEESTHSNEALLVVVVDDEKSIREGLRHLLELWGYQVITGTNAQVVMSQLEQTDTIPDAIISDFRLKQGQTGIDVINLLHSTYCPNIPAIIVTGDIDKKRLEDINASQIQFLSKPVPPAKLRAFLRSAETQKSRIT